MTLLLDYDKVWFYYDDTDPLYEDELGEPTERLRALTVVFQTYFFM